MGKLCVLSGAASKYALRTAGARVSGAAVGPGFGAELRGAASISPPRAGNPPPHLMCREKPDTMILTRKLDLCLAVRPTAGASCGGDLPRRKCHPALPSRCLTFCAFAALSEEARNRVTRVSWSGGGGVWGNKGRSSGRAVLISVNDPWGPRAGAPGGLREGLRAGERP